VLLRHPRPHLTEGVRLAAWHQSDAGLAAVAAAAACARAAWRVLTTCCQLLLPCCRFVHADHLQDNTMHTRPTRASWSRLHHRYASTAYKHLTRSVSGCVEILTKKPRPSTCPAHPYQSKPGPGHAKMQSSPCLPQGWDSVVAHSIVLHCTALYFTVLPSTPV
jgi:hypothetical protein